MVSRGSARLGVGRQSRAIDARSCDHRYLPFSQTTRVPSPHQLRIQRSRKMRIHILVILLVTVMARYLAAVHFDPAIPCKTGQDCVDMVSDASTDPTCKNGYCACKIGTGIKNCSSADIGHRINGSPAGQFIFGSCRLNHECQPNNSFCNTTISRCQCRKDYVLSNVRGECLKKAETADFPCVDDKQCLAFSSDTSCRNGVCSCAPGHHYARDACYKTIDIGEACAREEECAHVNAARCTDRSVCDCAAETVLGQDKKSCLPVAREILDSCEENVQCSETFSNAVCVDGRCECRDRYHFEAKLNECFVDKGLGEDCGNTYECYQPQDGNATEKRLRCAENVCVYAENRAREDHEGVNGSPTTIAASLFSILSFVIVTRAAHLVQY